MKQIGSRFPNPELATDRAGSGVSDLSMAGDCGPPTVRRVLPDGMVRAFPSEDAAMTDHMSDQIMPLHDTTIPAGTSSKAVLALRCR